MRPRVYTASKISQAEYWCALEKQWPEIEFTARWISTWQQTHDRPRLAWLIDRADIARSDFLICLATGEEPLRGALVEAGMAIAMGVTVIIIGDSKDYGSWKHHPMVMQAGSLEHARKIILGEV